MITSLKNAHCVIHNQVSTLWLLYAKRQVHIKGPGGIKLIESVTTSFGIIDMVFLSTNALLSKGGFHAHGKFWPCGARLNRSEKCWICGIFSKQCSYPMGGLPGTKELNTRPWSCTFYEYSCIHLHIYIHQHYEFKYSKDDPWNVINDIPISRPAISY